MGPIVALFNFTLRQTLLSRKIWLSVLILAAPCALVLVIRHADPSVHQARTLWEIYHVFSQFFSVSLLIPLVCMVHGTSLIGAEAENRTIVYLITRRMRRTTVLVVKFVATALVLTFLCDLSMIGLHFSLLGGVDTSSLITHIGYAHWDPLSDLRCYLTVVPVAVVGFLAIFSLIGLLTARALTLSVLYLVIVELCISNLPLQARVYSLSHQLRVSMAGAIPRVTDLYELPSDLREALYPQGASALPELFGIVLVALTLSCVLITVRELLPAKMERE